MVKTGLIRIFTSVCAAIVVIVAMIGFGTSAQSANALQATPAATRVVPPSVQATPLVNTAKDGMPSGVDQATWNKALGVALVTAGSSNIDIELAGLVPNASYSAWGVNASGSPAMTMLGSAAMTADAHGNASLTIPMTGSYQQLAVVYLTAGTSGDISGKLGSAAYTQLWGDFPGMASAASLATPAAMTAMTMSTGFSSVTFNGIPPNADKTMWNGQIGVATTTMGTSGTDSIILRLGRLVPNGLYTAWWSTTNPRGTAQVGQAPNNGIKADADGWASLTFEVPSNNMYNRLSIFFQADGNMPGPTTPGVMGSVAYIALTGAFPGPAGTVAQARNPRAGAPLAATMAATAAQ